MYWFTIVSYEMNTTIDKNMFSTGSLKTSMTYIADVILIA